jgi:hypothetical protein
MAAFSSGISDMGLSLNQIGTDGTRSKYPGTNDGEGALGQTYIINQSQNSNVDGYLNMTRQLLTALQPRFQKDDNYTPLVEEDNF